MLLLVSGDDRDRGAWPDASRFEMALPDPMRGVARLGATRVWGETADAYTGPMRLWLNDEWNDAHASDSSFAYVVMVRGGVFDQEFTGDYKPVDRRVLTVRVRADRAIKRGPYLSLKGLAE